MAVKSLNSLIIDAAQKYIDDTTSSYDPANVDISGGEIDGTTIGANSAAQGTFTSVNSPDVTATSSAGVSLKNLAGTSVLTVGGGNGTGASFAGGITVTGTLNGKDPDLLIESDVAGVTGADAVTNIISLTQAEYDAITPDSSTFYIIVG